MKLVLLTGRVSPERLQAALDAANAETDPDRILILPDHTSATASAEPYQGPILEVRQWYSRDGGFQPLRLARSLKGIATEKLGVVVLDGDDGIMHVLDRFGNRAGELPYHFMKQFFYAGPRPHTIIHFVSPQVVLHSARFWAEWIKYPPMESMSSHLHDDAMNRLRHIIHEMDHLRSEYHPWDKFKLVLRGKLARLKFWRR